MPYHKYWKKIYELFECLYIFVDLKCIMWNADAFLEWMDLDLLSCMYLHLIDIVNDILIISSRYFINLIEGKTFILITDTDSWQEHFIWSSSYRECDTGVQIVCGNSSQLHLDSCSRVPSNQTSLLEPAGEILGRLGINCGI